MLTTLVAIDRAKLAGAAGKIVPAEHFTSLLQAREAVAEAQQYAARLRAQADAKVAAACQEGFERGRQEARAELAASMVETTARMQSAFLSLEARIVQTVMTAVQQVLGELDERTLMEHLVRRVLTQARAQKQVRLRVAAAQFDEVNDSLKDILCEWPDVELVDVLKDPQAPPGTCVLESDFGIVDASVQTQLAALRRGLVNAFVGKRLAASVTCD